MVEKLTSSGVLRDFKHKVGQKSRIAESRRLCHKCAHATFAHFHVIVRHGIGPGIVNVDICQGLHIWEFVGPIVTVDRRGRLSVVQSYLTETRHTVLYCTVEKNL